MEPSGYCEHQNDRKMRVEFEEIKVTEEMKEEKLVR